MKARFVALLFFAQACSSLSGPHQVEPDPPDAGPVGAHPDAGAPPDAAPPKPKPDAGAPDAAPPKPGPDAGPVVTAIETIAPATATSGQKLDIRCELRDSNGDP